MDKRCAAIKTNGEQCQNACWGKHKTCHFHSQPGLAAKLGAKGGRRRATFDLSKLTPLPPPKTIEEVRDLLALTLTEVRTGVLDPKLGTQLTYIAGELRATIESHDIERQLEKLLAEGPGTSAWCPPLPEGAVKIDPEQVEPEKLGSKKVQ